MPAHFRKTTVRQFTVITAPVFVIALLGSEHSLGQQQASPEQQRTDSRGNVIEEVVVTANRRPQRIPEIARSVLVLDELVLEENLAKTPNIGDLLGTSVPGFGPPSETDISRVLTLRGREVQYLIDGVPVQFNGGAGYGGFALAKFDPEIIGRVEVLYGPTAVYGSGATGGVIQYFTRSAPDGDPFQLRVRIQATTFFEDFADRDSTSYKYTVGASGDMGRFDYLASYSFDDQRGLIDGAGDLVNPVFYGFTEEDFYFLKAGVDLSDSQRLEMFYNFTEFRTDRPASELVITEDGRATANLISDPPATGPSALSPFNEKTFWNISYSNTDVVGGSLLVQYYDRQDERAGGLIDLRAASLLPTWPAGWPDNYVADFVDDGKGFRTQFSYEFTDRINLTAGIDQDEQTRASNAQVYTLTDDFDESGDIGTVLRDGLFAFPFDLKTRGVFAQLEYRLSESVRLSGGVRYEDVEFSIGAGGRIFERTLDDSGSQVSRPGGAGTSDGDAWNVGVTWDAFSWASLFANISQGFEVPALSSVAGIVPPDQELRSNEAVSPQIVDNYEIGFRGDYANWRYSFAAYFADSELGQNFIYDPVTNQGEYNRSPQENYGFEAVLGWSPVLSVDVLGTLSWGEGDFDPDGEGPEREVPLTTLDVPPWKFTLNGRYRLSDNMGFNALLLVVGDRDRAFDEGVDLYEIDGYTRLDIGLDWRVWSGTLSAQLTNALDETYITPTSQTYIGNPLFAPRVAGASGRSLSVAYNVSF